MLLVGLAVQGRQEEGQTATFDNVSIAPLAVPDLVSTKGALLTGRCTHTLVGGRVVHELAKEGR